MNGCDVARNGLLSKLPQRKSSQPPKEKGKWLGLVREKGHVALLYLKLWSLGRGSWVDAAAR